MRAFLAFDPDDALLDGATSLVAALRDAAGPKTRVKWSARDTMHVTACFLGEIAKDAVPALRDVVERIGVGRGAPAVRASRLGGFPDTRRARVLVAPLEDDGTMAALAGSLWEGLSALGFAREDRAYHAHLTLGRCKEPVDVRRLEGAVRVALEGRLVALTLYESELGPQGPTYTALARRTLSA